MTWKFEGLRHSLARKRIKTGRKKKLKSTQPKYFKYKDVNISIEKKDGKYYGEANFVEGYDEAIIKKTEGSSYAEVKENLKNAIDDIIEEYFGGGE